MAGKKEVEVCGQKVDRRVAWWLAILVLSSGIGVVVDSFQKANEDILDRSSATIDELDLDDWTPHHVGLWMEREGFGKYSQSFVDQAIEGDRLCELEASDLVEAEMTDSREQARLFRAIATLRKSKVNDRNPTANGFWEYRSVNRPFVAVALPAIVMCPRTWVLATFLLDNENIEHILNPDSRRTAADDPRNDAGWTSILDDDSDEEEFNASRAYESQSGEFTEQPKMSSWREQARLSTILSLTFFPHGVAAIWLLGFADTDPLLVVALVIALTIAQLKEFLDLYHMLTSDFYVSTTDKRRFWYSWIRGMLFSAIVFYLVRMVPHTVLDAGFYSYVAAACLQGALELWRLTRKTIAEEMLMSDVAVQRRIEEEEEAHALESAERPGERLGETWSAATSAGAGTISRHLSRTSSGDPLGPRRSAHRRSEGPGKQSESSLAPLEQQNSRMGSTDLFADAPDDTPTHSRGESIFGHIQGRVSEGDAIAEATSRAVSFAGDIADERQQGASIFSISGPTADPATAHADSDSDDMAGVFPGASASADTAPASVDSDGDDIAGLFPVSDPADTAPASVDSDGDDMAGIFPDSAPAEMADNAPRRRSSRLAVA